MKSATSNVIWVVVDGYDREVCVYDETTNEYVLGDPVTDELKAYVVDIAKTVLPDAVGDGGATYKSISSLNDIDFKCGF